MKHFRNIAIPESPLDPYFILTPSHLAKGGHGVPLREAMGGSGSPD
jgi:hypothetical protein